MTTSEQPRPGLVVEQIRRYFEEFINRHDLPVLEGLVAPNYRVSVAGNVLDLAAYRRAAENTFEVFPDLRVTVHEVLARDDRVAVRITADGTSPRHQGNRAVWGGVGLYTWGGDRFVDCWIEEDYHLVRAQLRTGRLELPIQAQGPTDPFAEAQVGEPGDGVVETARRWLESGADGLTGIGARVDALLAVGERVAFHTSAPGIHVAGMATVHDDGSIDRVGAFSDGGAVTGVRV